MIRNIFKEFLKFLAFIFVCGGLIFCGMIVNESLKDESRVVIMPMIELCYGKARDV